MSRFLSAIVTLCFFTACMGQQKKTIRYVAIGDSYTIGTGAKAEEAWPSLLAKHLAEKGIPVELVGNFARNGYSTQDLIDYELHALDSTQADFVTLLIGVNDWVRGVGKEIYQKKLQYVLDHIQKTSVKKILLVTIPDFGVTPQGEVYARGRNISQGIYEFNSVIKAEAKERKLPCVDIFSLSKKMKSNPSLVADDELHPSAKEYAEWEKVIFIVAHKYLSAE